MKNDTDILHENESSEHWDPHGHDPVYEPWNEVLINDYLDRLKSLETETLRDISHSLMRYSAWGVGLSSAYARFTPGFEFTALSISLFGFAWLCWFVAIGCILYSYHETGVFTWFNQSVGLYRRYLPGIFWVYRERFYVKVLISLIAFGLGFVVIVVFVILDQYDYIESLFLSPKETQ